MRVLGCRHFLLVEKSSMSVYSYEGRLLASPRWPNLHTSTLNKSQLSLSPDTVALRDQADDKCEFLKPSVFLMLTFVHQDSHSVPSF